ncbi:MAG: hypothetical protein HY699_09535 [Deltaproteobacteria bacterium]|nr:hypothetical protein [Deltaproteobacteria bacterium]
MAAPPGLAQEQVPEPEARATQRAVERAERRRLRLNPQAGTQTRDPQPVELRDPLPLPVELRNLAALLATGKPVGEACPGSEPCVLKLTPAVREVVVITSVWSAAKVECDDLKTSSPSNGTPIAPWWSCKRQLLIEGPGAGYTGFVVIK